MTRRPVLLEVNGRKVETFATPNQTLLEVLREEFGASDVKYGCGEGTCGTCTVLVDSDVVSACTILAVQVSGSTVMTVRGLGSGEGGGLHPLQACFLEHGASQCGFCTPGMVLTAYAFVRDHPAPTRDDIRRALEGNLCRCTGYVKIIDAVEAYARSHPAGGLGED